LDQEQPHIALVNRITVARDVPIQSRRYRNMMLLLLVIIILLFAAAPAWPYSRSWGYYPSGGLGTVLLILILLMLFGYVHI
jgi:hypothetical protein